MRHRDWQRLQLFYPYFAIYTDCTVQTLQPLDFGCVACVPIVVPL